MSVGSDARGNEPALGLDPRVAASPQSYTGQYLKHLRMDNLADEEKEIAMLLFIDVHSETGELGDYDYAKSDCDGTIPPKGSFNCKLALIFPAAPKQISLRVGEGMAGETVSFTLAQP